MMKITSLKILVISLLILVFGCVDNNKQQDKTAQDILGNPNYLAISYGGYRHVDHNIEPTLEELKGDMKILAAMGIKVLRTYKVNLPHASNVLKAIEELKKEDPSFEMYVMLGAWINCKNAFNWEHGEPNHNEESEQNAVEIQTAVDLANKYPDIVKVIAVGNEAMVKWATGYYVQPSVILKWVNYLQGLKEQGKLPKNLWITSSDNFASWGGGGSEYHTEDLENLIKAVDYISMHTYPFHDSHYNPGFWEIPESEFGLTDLEKIDAAMIRAKNHAVSQYQGVYNYMKSLGVNKLIHIGETGWSSASNGLYGFDGSCAADEYKQALYYKHIRNWTNEKGISCFFFEAFDEPWKDAKNPLGSENHFGLFTKEGNAKYVLWDLVDNGVFKHLSRTGKPIKKTFDGNFETLIKTVKTPFVKE